MKKGFYLPILSFLLACFGLLFTTLPVFAAPARVTISANQVAHTNPIWRGKRRVGWGRFPHGGPGSQEINQFHLGDSNYNNPVYPVGHGQGNTGNHVYNRGHNQDNSSNSGNQLVMLKRLRGYRRINQYSYGRSNYNNLVGSRGYDQGNSGNDGHNDGLNQDNSLNSGNQILN